MDTAADVSSSATSASPVAGQAGSPDNEAASADAHAMAKAARLAVARQAEVLSAMQTAQDAVAAAVRGMARSLSVSARGDGAGS